MDVIGDLRQVSLEIDKCKENIATLNKNSNMIMKQLQLSTLEKMLEELTVKRSNLDRTAGKTEERISLTKQKIAENQANHVEKALFYEKLGADAADLLPIWRQEYGSWRTRETPH